MEHAATGFLPCALLFPLRVLRSCCGCYPSRCAHYDKSSLRILVKPLSRLSCFPQTLSQQLTQFSPTQPLWPAPQSPLRAASQQLSPMLFPGGSPTLGSPVRGNLPVGQVQQVLFAPLPVQQQQLQQATAQQAGSPQQ